MITEKKYPPILWSSYRPDVSPENIEIAVFNQKELGYMKKSKAFKNFMALLGFDYYQGNSLELRMKKEISLPSFQPHRHVYLSENAFKKVEYDLNFRNKMFPMSKSVPSSSGTITFKNGGCYIYRILSPEDSQVHVKANFTDFKVNQGCKYFAVAFFCADNFMGFEEGSISASGEILVNNGDSFYSPNNDIGQYLGFTFISLSAYYFDFFKSKVLPPQSELNQTNQSINFLEV